VTATGRPPRSATGRGLSPALLAAALVVLALNLRATVAALPPLLPDVQRDLGLSGAAAGALTALPVLCMALFSPGSHRVAHRLGREATALAGVALIAIGNGLRLAGTFPPALYGGTLLAGIGIAACGVVLAGIVKEFFPRREGAASAAYIVAMMLGAAVAPAVAVPLERLLGSWQASLAAWGVPAALAVAIWIPICVRLNTREPGAGAHPGRLPLRSRPAWLVAGFLSLQASIAYAYIAWLAPAYRDHGWSAVSAGALLGGIHFFQLFTALLLPILADRSDDRRRPLMAAVGCTVVGAVWLFALPDLLPWAAVAALGLGLGGGFALSLVLIVDYAADPAASSRLAAMAFRVCYSAAAAAQVAVGALHDATGGFGVPFGLLAVMALVQLAMATRLGPRHRGSVR
jgi:MFS transporter, CP family, cyanate transporter